MQIDMSNEAVEAWLLFGNKQGTVWPFKVYKLLVIQLLRTILNNTYLSCLVFLQLKELFFQKKPFAIFYSMTTSLDLKLRELHSPSQ